MIFLYSGKYNIHIIPKYILIIYLCKSIYKKSLVTSKLIDTVEIQPHKWYKVVIVLISPASLQQPKGGKCLHFPAQAISRHKDLPVNLDPIKSFSFCQVYECMWRHSKYQLTRLAGGEKASLVQQTFDEWLLWLTLSFVLKILKW
jgi:hypothetical protein